MESRNIGTYVDMHTTAYYVAWLHSAVCQYVTESPGDPHYLSTLYCDHATSQFVHVKTEAKARLETLGSARTVQYAQLLVDLFTTTGQEEFLFSAKAGSKLLTHELRAIESVDATTTTTQHMPRCSNSNKLVKQAHRSGREIAKRPRYVNMPV